MTSVNLSLEPNEFGTHTFEPGEVLKGNVSLTVDQVKKFRGFNIHIFGEAECRFSHHGGDKITSYTGTEPFIDARIPLFNECVIQPGTYAYEFSFKLPSDLPYSLKIDYSAKIYYYVEAELLIKGKKNETSGVEFKVVRYDDLNLYPELKTAVKCTGTKKFFKFFLQGKTPFQMIATIPQKGFAIKQFAPVTIDYKNDSHVNIYQTDIRLIRIADLTCPIEGKPAASEHQEVIFETYTDGVLAMTSKTIQSGFTIPNVYVSNNKYCHIISLKYFIEVVARADGVHSNKKIRLPITIGQVPLKFD